MSRVSRVARGCGLRALEHATCVASVIRARLSPRCLGALEHVLSRPD